MTKPVVLVVEDNPVMRDSLIMVLELEGMGTLAASHGDETLALMREKSPDLVILDMELPGGMSGFDVLRAIRSDPKLAATPVMLHTAEPSAASLVEAGAADLVLLKPADIDDLITLIYRLLKRAGH